LWREADDGLVAQWHFDEGAGSVLHDSSGNENDGVIHDATWTDGKSGGALSFDGGCDYVDYGNVLNIGTSPNTIYAWFKTSSNKTQGSGS
jgi:hypothetical protein